MVVSCPAALSPRFTFRDLLAYQTADRVRLEENRAFNLEGLPEWYNNPGESDGLAIVSLNLLLAELSELLVFDHGMRRADSAQLAAMQFVSNYRSNLTRLDGSRQGPVGMYPTGFAIIDNLAAGRMNNAQTLRDQSVQLLSNRDYSEQQGYAEDKERMRDPENYVWIIPQRIFVFAHELMGQREGQAKQPWDHWDVIGDDDYIAAARAVYTKDIAEAAQVLCKLCNLHVEYSNPFPEGDNDDHLVGIEFDTPVRTLWPTEIFAWLRLRHERGLPLPVVDHPLLNQPLGQFDPAAKPVADHEPWFTELVNKLAAFQPRYASLPEMVFENP